ncbi:uncharacterized protein BO66DRAFT_443240 [Aspergillus aculeatinus CBS 121060]|uniref:Uncharacterized protein n=1 Tax=Aspergillus aculeatinus CBS 121060 TaxID=1448322 RepID=A0ACD1GV51_9EURO|nr:hypothetical protein BO66DRAFT_443240 [Aspergillus aculeatinus CBS 121060]RAH65247.1 hypothetical protein BO66DRAFT_443240 [Aspergillus aculeatinus CBS 121060]
MAQDTTYRMSLFLTNLLNAIREVSANDQQLQNAELVVVGDLAAKRLAHAENSSPTEREFVMMVDTQANMLALRRALANKPKFSSVDGQLHAKIQGGPIPIVLIHLDQLDPRPFVGNMVRLPQIDSDQPPYSDAGLTRDEMEALVARYRSQGRGDGVEGGSVLVGFGLATVLLWACVSWLWKIVFA